MRQPDNPPAFCRVHRNGRPLIGRIGRWVKAAAKPRSRTQITCSGAVRAATQAKGWPHLSAALRAAPRRRQNVISAVGPQVVQENVYACCSERARLDSGSSVSLLGPGTLANSLSP
jgi:hypothetical protein